MTEEESDRIEAFLNGEMDFAELSAGLDAEGKKLLRAEVAAERAARTAVFAAGIREDLKALHERESAPPRVRRAPVWYAVAAAVVLIVFAGLWWLQPAEEGRYAAYGYRDPGLPVAMGVAEDPAFAEAMTLFKQERYWEAAAEFGALTNGTATNDTLNYYAGVSAFYAGEYGQATPRLKAVANDATSLFRDKARWILVLSYLESDRTGLARDELGYILADPDNRFFDRASRLAGELGERE
jgi:hypothetical protein